MHDTIHKDIYIHKCSIQSFLENDKKLSPKLDLIITKNTFDSLRHKPEKNQKYKKLMNDWEELIENNTKFHFSTHPVEWSLNEYNKK